MPADFDRDGDLDFFVVNNNQQFLYLENVWGQRQNWAVVQLQGERSNSFGIGSRVELTAGGRSQVRELHLGSGYLSSPPPEAHFGLGDTRTIDRITVRWPTGETQVVDNLKANQIILIEESRGFRYVNPEKSKTGPVTP